MQAIDSIGYQVYFENNLETLASFIVDKNYSQVIILVDSNTNEHCLPFLQASLPSLVQFDIIEIDPGEENKNIDYCIGVWKTMLDFEVDRKAVMLNLGGGVVTDMGGFAASTYKRGIDFIHVPTTLLSQVDASVGGKTGIDLDNVKNIVGTFSQPQAVYISSTFLKTLDQRQLLSGFSEVIKHGLIQDRDFYNTCSTLQLSDINETVVYRSVEIKNNIVKQDPTEKGLRKILNFGHTIGHAIEGYSLLHDQDPLLHGEAIAVGMICEAWLSNKYTGLPEEDLQDICTLFMKLFPKYSFSKEQYPDTLNLMKNDKKNDGKQIGFALLKEIGNCTYNIYVSEEDIKSSLDFYLNLK